MNPPSDWPRGPREDTRAAIAAVVAEACARHDRPAPSLTWGRRRFDSRRMITATEPPRVPDPFAPDPNHVTTPSMFSTGFYRPSEARLHMSPGSSAEESLIVALHEVAHHLCAEGLRTRRVRGQRRTVHGEEFWRAALDLYEEHGIDRDLVLLRQVLRSPAAKRVWRETHGPVVEPFRVQPLDDTRAHVVDRSGDLLGTVWSQRLTAPPGTRWRSGQVSIVVWYGHACALDTMPLHGCRTSRTAVREVALEALAFRREAGGR